MSTRSGPPLRLWGWLLAAVVLLGGVWLLPIDGQLVVEPEAGAAHAAWPQMRAAPALPRPGESFTVEVTDNASWAHVRLTVDGRPAQFVEWRARPGLPVWTWTFRAALPAGAAGPVELAFYHDCHTGCRRRGVQALGRPSAAAATPAPPRPTKLCTALPDPERNWRGRQGWVVDMAYARLADDEDDPYWTVDALAGRVHRAAEEGHRVLVRIEYDRGQTLPPENDFLALTDYLGYVRRLAADERLRLVYAFVVGSGANGADANLLAPGLPATPEWVARVFNGAGEPVEHNDNVAQIVRAAQPGGRVLVGPVRPWVADQNGSLRYTVDAPWLNYMNTLTAALDAGAQAKAVAGFPNAAPDGFALHAPGRPDAANLPAADAAEEPQITLRRPQWGEAQAGFRVYRDWLAIVNSYPTTRGLPAYITATNTYAPDAGTPPAQNYPEGWLTSALAEIDAQPQVHALCWFLDLLPGDPQWDAFSLARGQGRMIYAAEEFDRLLAR